MTQLISAEMVDGVFRTGLVTITNWDSIAESGPYYGTNTASNAPSAAYYHGFANLPTALEGWVIAVRSGSDEIWFRRKQGGTWATWNRIGYPISQAEAENAASAVAGLISGLRINQALVAGLSPALADLAVDAIGAYGTFQYNGTALDPGDTTAGTNLQWASLTGGGENVGSSPPGTWMCCGYHGDSVSRLSTFRRIS